MYMAPGMGPELVGVALLSEVPRRSESTWLIPKVVAEITRLCILLSVSGLVRFRLKACDASSFKSFMAF